MSASGKLCLLRHGATTGAPSRCWGWTDLPLADPKATLTHLKAQRFEGARAIVSSDLSRARETAALLRRLQPKLQDLGEAPALRELNFGAWEGLSWAEIQAKDPAAYQAYLDDWRNEVPPGGESWLELKARVAAWLEGQSNLQGLVVVAHHSSLRALSALVSGRADAEAFAERWEYAEAKWRNLRGLAVPQLAGLSRPAARAPGRPRRR